MAYYIKNIGLFCIIALSISCKQHKSNDFTKKTESPPMKEFEWRPTECAPEHYPITIYKGDFITEDNHYFPVPYGGIVGHGWGEFGSTWVTGPDFKSVPVKLKIIWISYTENQFYFGDFDLPKDKITDLFEKGYTNRHGRHVTYDNLTVGLAPGGAVSVWIMGAGNYVEIGHYQAVKTEVAMKDFKPHADSSLDEYVQNRRNAFSDETKEILAKEGIPIGKWTAYRKAYNWKPTFKHKNGGVLIDFLNKFYNGEFYNIGADNAILNEYKEYPPSERMGFNWHDKNNNRYGGNIKFDEKEIWDAFKKIFANPETKQAELVLEIDKYNSHLKITLESKNDTIAIEKAKIKIYETSN